MPTRGQGSGAVLTRAFFARSSTEVARDLLGRVVESVTDDGLVSVRLVEVEAYGGQDDPASHAWRGPTPRNQVMYGPPGHAYVYFTYGMHWCLNVVTGDVGAASAVLLRAGQVVAGRDLAARRRGGVPDVRLARGPATLAQALGVDGGWDGMDLARRGARLRIRSGEPVADAEVAAGPRIGVSRGTDTPWRYVLAGNPHVSGPRRTGG